ncbi:MAG TPA: EamA family transporter, partial [Bordetella sp.]|uniref:DMT family transporter n=1 Tax=Bordetella sp. TaxID=28081 RepID=UPI002ED51BC0
MSSSSRSAVFADLLLLAVALVWGSSYGIVKKALLVYPVLGLIALRFALTFVLLSPALRALRGLARGDALAVAGAGLLLLCIFVAETFGVRHTHASNAAFLISLCVVLTPLAEWLWLKRAPRRIEWLAAGLSLIGAFLISGGSLVLTPGDALMVLAALLRALNVCVTKRAMQSGRLPPLALTAAQAGVVAGGCLLLAWIVGRDQWQPLPSFTAHYAFWAYVGYLVLGCTLFAFFVQNYAVHRSSATRVALL